MHYGSRSDKLAKILLVIAVFMVFAGLTAYYFLAQYRAVAVERGESARLLANHLELQLNSRLTALQMLASDPDTVDGFSEQEEAEKELSLVVGVFGFSNIVLYDKNAQVVVKTNHNVPSQPVKDRVSFEAALSGKSVISGRICQDGLKDAYVSMRVPVVDGYGETKGVLAAEMPIAEISRLVNDHSFYNNEYAFIIDGESRLIYHPQSDVIFDKEQSYTQWKEFFRQQDGKIIIISAFDQVKKLFAYTEVVNTDWRVIVAVPLSEVFTIVLRKSLPDIVLFLLLLSSIALLYHVVAQSKRHQKELENSRLERLMSTSQMVAGIAHEIRNPLTSIKGFVQLIMCKNNNPPPKHYLDIIYSEIERIEKLLNEFQVLARPAKPSQFTKIDMVKVINGIVMLMQAQALGKVVTLDVDYQQNQHLPVIYQVRGDEAQLKQVLINLVRNAIEAVDEGGNITVTLSLEDSMVAIAVKDNGAGIPPEVLAKLGTPFYTTKQQGTGLGLSVCYSIINNHKGKIEVVSKVGQGTVFTVLLPYSASVHKETEK